MENYDKICVKSEASDNMSSYDSDADEYSSVIFLSDYEDADEQMIQDLMENGTGETTEIVVTKKVTFETHNEEEFEPGFSKELSKYTQTEPADFLEIPAQPITAQYPQNVEMDNSKEVEGDDREKGPEVEALNQILVNLFIPRWRLWNNDDPADVIAMFDVLGQEKVQRSSFYNPEEIRKVREVLYNIFSYGNIPTSDIGIITPYEAQKTEMLIEFAEERDEKFKKFLLATTVQTIGAFQSQNRNVILVSFVRANDSYKEQIGFLNDGGLLNTAMTRANKRLLLFGNIETLSKNEFYRNLVQYVKRVGKIY